MAKLSTASVLAFERNLDISDCTFEQLDSQNPDNKKTVVNVREKSVRGTISNRLKNTITNDPAKLDAEIEKANLQKVDVATLDNDKDTLVACFSCKVLPFTGKPNVCNDPDYQIKLLSTVQSYLNETGLSTLARRYAINIANARWLWRNRIGAEKIHVTVSCSIDGEKFSLSFDNAKNLPLNSFDIENEQIDQLAKIIEQGFKNEQFVILYIEAQAIVGYGQEVYPSQELILDTGKTKSKVLYQIGDVASIHSQKIGNALRTIDTWYSDDAQFPIAAEPYGSVTTLGTAFRQPKAKKDFYTLFDNWILKDEKPSPEDQHYVISVLIRGGVFGAAGKE
ncbi:type I-F CRISPR-associated protein Csy3 [Advenella alkanexedens]|uniref:Type I-F CRISPR-associated protein Csy3 n=1 Tax=Advenella alkanexedens TaxID=1481665 RepID=A0ABS6NPJ3_9BURK|nr:type I-F CRISPR-associated protein Csy3 [Advenella alkanexedens]MBV4397106.1 type I-F CRISPR-associated protein Csy3 [Advenella alkanexedens]